MFYGMRRRLERLEASQPGDGRPVLDLGGYYDYVLADDQAGHLAALDPDDPTRQLVEAMDEAFRRVMGRPDDYEARLAGLEGRTPRTLGQAIEEAVDRGREGGKGAGRGDDPRGAGGDQAASGGV